MSPYLRADQIIHDMAIAVAWIVDIDDIRVVRRELICAGFNEDDVDHYAECAVTYVRAKRALFSGLNQMTAESNNEDQ